MCNIIRFDTTQPPMRTDKYHIHDNVVRDLILNHNLCWPIQT